MPAWPRNSPWSFGSKTDAGRLDALDRASATLVGHPHALVTQRERKAISIATVVLTSTVQSHVPPPLDATRRDYLA